MIAIIVMSVNIGIFPNKDAIMSNEGIANNVKYLKLKPNPIIIIANPIIPKIMRYM